MTEIPTDPWGNPYHYVAGDGYADKFGFYSSGINGRSETQGNDPDDINSWSEHPREPLIDLKLHRGAAVFVLTGALTIGFLIGRIVTQNRIGSANPST